MPRTPFSYSGRDLEAMSFAVNYHRWILSDIRSYIGSQVAEVGAGSGDFSQFLLEENVQKLFAYEPSSTMYPRLAQRFAGNSRVEALNDFFSESEELEQRFDTICYINVLEHIQNDYDELLLARERLKKGGFLCLFVPALPLLYSPLDREIGHHRRYLKSNLKRLVASSGLAVLTAKYFDIIGILPWYIACVLLKKRLSTSNVSIYDRFIIPLERKIETLISPVIGKNILLVAQKP